MSLRRVTRTGGGVGDRRGGVFNEEGEEGEEEEEEEEEEEGKWRRRMRREAKGG
jgi:hypothetical protein